MFGRLFERWALAKQVKEGHEFLSRMKSMNSDELAIPLVLTLEAAQMYSEEKGIDVFDPFTAIAKDPSASLYFSSLVNELQRKGRQVLASGAMVWAHTLRATVNHELRDVVREVWVELNRGLPHIEAARMELLEHFGLWPDLEKAGLTPVGMEPKR